MILKSLCNYLPYLAKKLASAGYEEIIDPFLWSRDLGSHSCGEYSFAAVQADIEIEDYSQVDTSRNAIFAGVYDGHGGPCAAQFVAKNLFSHLISRILKTEKITEDEIRHAFSATSDKFHKTVVQTSFETDPLIAFTGSCCLMGLISSGTLFVANAGDSRAVLGSVLDDESNTMVFEQLTVNHNASHKDHRLAPPPDDQSISFTNQQFEWRVEGLIQASRSRDYVNMKRPDFYLGEESPEHDPRTAVPSVLTRVLTRNDRFLILASDGLWDNVTNQKAAEMVHNNRNTRLGVAKRLLEMGLNAAIANNRTGIKFDLLKFLSKTGIRAHVHDDITVIVIYIDHEEQLQGKEKVSETSLSGYVDIELASEFSRMFDHCS